MGDRPLEIAPHLLVVLIENAFKFVSDHSDRENRIIIRMHTRGSVLHSSFVNTKEPQPESFVRSPGGIGITNLKRRLELLYAGKYQLTTDTSDDVYETTLIVDLA